MELIPKNDYQSLVELIAETYQQGQQRAVLAINTHLVETYWQIGQYIVEFEQGGNAKAGYGKGLLPKLSKDLTLALGKGFSESNVARMRQFYMAFPIFATLSQKLTWSHWVELLKIDDPLERSFYIQQTQIENWSFRDLKRQKNTSLFLRLAASKDKEGMWGQINMYLGYFENEENTEGDNPPIGIVLAKEKDELLVKYAMHNISSQLFVSKYQLYLPNREELQALILKQLNNIDDEL